MSSERVSTAKRVAEEFAQLPDEAKNQFVWDTLNVLANMNERQAKQLIKKFAKRGRPSQDDVETINQMALTFLYSIKEEFRNQWAVLVYRFLRQPVPESVVKKMDDARSYRYIHIKLRPQTFERVEKSLSDLNVQDWDLYFERVLSPVTTEQEVPSPIPKSNSQPSL